MPLPLSDPRWKSLEGSYGTISDALRWLEDAYDPAKLTLELLGDLINEVHHQGDSSSAMYAVAPHLIVLAENADPQMKFSLLVSAGMIYARAGRDGRADLPDFLDDCFCDAALLGAEMLAPLLGGVPDFQDFHWGIAALSAFKGHDYFSRFLSNVELYEGQIHYQLLDHTIPVDP